MALDGLRDAIKVGSVLRTQDGAGGGDSISSPMWELGVEARLRQLSAETDETSVAAIANTLINALSALAPEEEGEESTGAGKQEEEECAVDETEVEAETQAETEEEAEAEA